MTHNKANKSKISALILGLTMCLALMLGIVFASPTFAAYAEGGTGTTGGLTIDGTSNITAPDGTYAYSATDKTLMLNGYNGGVIRFTAEGDVTVNLVNGRKNTITLTDGAVTENQYGVYAAGNLTVTGKGTLDINLDISGSGDEITTEYGKALYGLYTKSLTVNGEINVNVNLISNGFSCGMFATGNITVAEKANVDVKCRSKYNNTEFYGTNKVVYGIYSRNGDIKLSGTGTKNIEHTCTVKFAQANEAKGVYAENDRENGGGRIEISGAKLTIKMPGEGAGIQSYYDCVIKNADISIVDAERGIAVWTKTPSATFKGVTIEKSKIYISTSGFARVESVGNVAGIEIYNAELSILDSNVYIESRSCISGSGEPTNLVFIKGASVVRLINPHENNRYVLNAYVSTFELSKGGSVTINSVCYNFYGIYDIKLGAGTKAEYGTKDSQSTNDSDAYYYETEYNDDLKLLRFVYGEGAGTATTSDVKVEGMKGYAIEESEFTVTLAGDTFTEIAQNTDVTSWFKNMPSGLVAKIKNKVEAGATSLTIAISGTPQSVETVRAYIEIPEKYLVTGEYDITIDPNKNKVDFSIVSGETIDVPVPSVTQFVYDGEAKVLLTDGEGYTVSNNKNTFAGEYTAVVTLKKGYKWADGTTDPINIPWTIKRQDITIEVTLTKTTYECTGYTIEPEYTVYRITPTGNVELPRSEYKGELTDNKDVGTATLVVKDNGIGNYNITNPVTVNFEIVKGTKTPPTGLTGVAPSADGAKDGKITGTTVDMQYSTDTEFTSPKPCTDTETTGLAEGTYYVRYKATPTTEASNYVAVHVRLNTVTVVDANTTVTKHKSGTSVTVTVTIPTGKSFKNWVYEGVTIPTTDVMKQKITFTMPEKDVVLTALFEDIIYNITVTNGTSSAPTAKYQEEVTVTADDPATGKEFDKWVVSGITLSDEDLAKSTVTFKMPASNVTMEATYKDVVYQVTVTNGTASVPTAKYQEEITVTANAPATDMYFDKWEVTGITLSDEDLAKSTLTFQMPAGNVTFTATYLSVTKYEIVVVDGTKDKSPAKAGETITITANPAKPGKVFDKWTCETAGVTIEFESATSSKTTFVMPACEITIKAHFRDIEAAPSIEIKVEGGTGGGTYKQGDEVTVTAEDKESKVFKCWKDESGKIVSTEKSYTFKVTGATTLTAVYEDKPSEGGEITPPAKNDGLSGGAIAGIVIGSVAVAGIGGFAIYWFAISKKTFADLGVALKKGFTAIGNFFKNLGAKIKALFTKKK